MRHVIEMTAAASIGLMSVFIVDLLSLLYVSRLGDPNLTAAVGFATQVLFFAVSINIGLSIAIGALVSRAIGAGNMQGAQRLAASGLVHTVVVTGVASGVALVLRHPILVLFGAQGEALDVASTYLAITLPPTIMLGLGMALGAILRAVGDARRAMYVTLAAAVVTAVLDPIFIFGFGLGVQGAAIVTIVSRFVLVIVGFYGAAVVHDLIRRPRLAAVIYDIPPMLTIAIPAVLTNLATPVASAYTLRIFAQFGDPIVAAAAIIDRLSPVVFGVLFALSGSVGPIMGQNLGARLMMRVRQVLTDCLVFAAVYVVFVSALLYLATPLVIEMFSATGATASLVHFYCAYGGALWLFLGALFVANAAFNNLGFAVLSTAFNWGRATLGVIPFVTLGAKHFGPEGGIVGLILGSALFGVGAILAAYAVTAQLAKSHADG